ncbi:MAG: tetratricopeptide repeat protein [Acidobacteriaceae bacterium]
MRAAALTALVACVLQPKLPAQQPQTASSMQAIETLVQQGKWDQARAALTDELQRNPSSVEAYNLLGITDSEQHDDDGALAAFRKALQLAPGSARTHNNLGNLYLAEKQFDLAEGEYRTVLRLDPENRDGNYNLATLLLQRGKPEKAIEYLERVHPADRASRLTLIEAELAGKRTEEALHQAAALSAENKQDVNLHYTLGVLLASQRQYSMAELELEKADALRPDTFQILYDLGQTYFLNGQYPRAELQLTQAVRIQPDSTRALYLLADTDWKQSQPLDALGLLVRARKLDPKNPDVILLMAQISMAQGYYEDAIPLLQEGLKIAPQRSDLRSTLGESYFKADQIDKAVHEFQTVVTTDPSARAYSFLGLSHTYLGQFDAAKEDFQNGLQRDPGNSFCLFNLGYIAERQGDTAAAAATFRKVLSRDPDFADALLELGSLEIQSQQYAAARRLLTRYVHVSRNPASGYYKLAVVERKLHQTGEANQDLAQFEKLSKETKPGSYRYEDLFDYLDQRAQLSPRAREQEDLTELIDQSKKHPDQPEILYMLAQAYLRGGNVAEARNTVAQLDQLKAGDDRTLAGAGVLFARFHMYDDAIRQFEAALQANPDSDDVKFDLANALFRTGNDAAALDVCQKVSEQERSDDAYLALLADIDAHLGQTARAEELDRNAIARSPQNDQNYLSLALLQFRDGDAAAARRTLLQGQARVPASGKIVWGLGISAVMDGNTAVAAKDFSDAVDLLPEWVGSYSMLGVFYYQTGQIAQAREVLEQFRTSSAAGGLDVSRIEQALDASSPTVAATNASLPMAKRQQLLQMALLLADRTL